MGSALDGDLAGSRIQKSRKGFNFVHDGTKFGGFLFGNWGSQDDFSMFLLPFLDVLYPKDGARVVLALVWRQDHSPNRETNEKGQ